MHSKTHSRSLAVSLALALPIVTTARPAATAPGPGDAFPTIHPGQVEGALPVIEGHVVLVDFWASWCGPCRKALPELNRLYATYRNRGLVVLGVSVDDHANDMEKFLDRDPVAFSVVRDRTKQVVANLQPTSMPTTYLVDRHGRIRYVHSGFHGDTTVNQLVAQVEALLAEPQ